jgi:hypothetical protein
MRPLDDFLDRDRAIGVIALKAWQHIHPALLAPIEVKVSRRVVGSFEG